MPSRSETRTSPRFPLVLWVTWRPKGKKEGAARPRAQGGETSDVSEHGLGVRLPVRLEEGTLLEVAVRTPEETIHLSGKVIWSRAGPSPPFPHGMVVAPETPKDRLAWENLLLEQAQRPDERPPRLAVTVPLSCQTVAGPLEGTARSVSPGGVCILLPRVLAEGEEVVLLVPHRSGLLEANGRVAWVEGEPHAAGLSAHGIVFGTPQTGRAAMEALVQADRGAAPSR